MNEAFGRRMRKLRGDMNQKDFANLIGSRQQHVSRYERGAFPSVPVLMEISRTTKVSIDWLLFGNEASNRRIPR